MSDTKKKLDYTKNKLAGKTKEAAGKVTGNERLELEGKIQSSKAEIKKKLSVKRKYEDIKEKMAGKTNDVIDRNKKHKK